VRERALRRPFSFWPLIHKETSMDAMKVFGIALIVAGALALAYGGFTYTKDSHDVKLGPIQFSVKEKETVSVPVWAGAGGIAVGVLLVLFGGRKK
jgi:multidrug transporter EmrE-like cation transporter